MKQTVALGLPSAFSAAAKNRGTVLRLLLPSNMLSHDEQHRYQ